MILFVITLSVIGAFIGSFLGVLVDRIPQNKSFIKGRSKCNFCNHDLRIFDLIPVFSYLSQKGKCRYCREKLSLFYPIIELTTGIMFVLIYLAITLNSQFSISSELSIFNFQLIYYLIIVSALIVVFFTDLKYGIIPDKILFPVILISFVWIFINYQSELLNHLLSAFSASVFFVTVSLLYYLVRKKNAMGGGDIKFAFFMGLFLGFPNIVVGLYSAFLTAALYSIILIIWRKKAFLKDSIPF